MRRAASKLHCSLTPGGGQCLIVSPPRLRTASHAHAINAVQVAKLRLCRVLIIRVIIRSWVERRNGACVPPAVRPPPVRPSNLLDSNRPSVESTVQSFTWEHRTLFHCRPARAQPRCCAWPVARSSSRRPGVQRRRHQPAKRSISTLPGEWSRGCAGDTSCLVS